MTKHRGRTVPPQPTPAPDTSERRIRACVKACEGLSTEALEDGMVKAVFDTPFEYRAVLADLRAVVERLHKVASDHCAAVELARGHTPPASPEQPG